MAETYVAVFLLAGVLSGLGWAADMAGLVWAGPGLIAGGLAVWVEHKLERRSGSGRSV